MRQDARHFAICLGAGVVAIGTMPETSGWILASVITGLLTDYGH
jgi:hypothetical protein